MIMRRITAIAAMALTLLPLYSQSKPTREVKMPTESNLGVKLHDYNHYKQGVFCSAELSGAYSPSASSKNIGYTELDIVGGYRFNDFLRLGVGLGARLFIDSSYYRVMNHNWGMPVFINARGNLIPNDYLDVVPFWTVDFGAEFPDGVMIRPCVGIRVGQPRSAFIASIGYVGQQIRCYSKAFEITHKMRSFITLKIGYEF